MTVVLVVDDVPAMAEQYAYDLNRVGGYEAIIAAGGRPALEMIGRDAIDCVILDLEMPDVDGFQVLRTLRDRKIDVPVIVYTGTGDFDRCIQAVRLGAYGFIDKGEPMVRVVREIENALELRRLALENRSLRRKAGDETPLIGSSPAMQQLKDAIGKIASIPSPVLVVGESGAGKEVVARALQRMGDRGDKPFLAINCAALPENLIESELFGHERGAFTGANRLRKGAFESAGEGTLFLDEIGELPLPAQAKLLRVLEEQRVTRIGGSHEIAISARVVAATNRDLDADVAAGRFREDLLYRLNPHVLRVPPLRERISDLPELARHLMETICTRFGIRPKSIDQDALDALMAHDWKRNNVRELRNVIERMIIAADTDRVERRHVPADLTDATTTTPAASTDFRSLKSEAERRIVISALERNNWRVTQTATELGLADHSSLLKIMRKLGIERQRAEGRG